MDQQLQQTKVRRDIMERVIGIREQQGKALRHRALIEELSIRRAQEQSDQGECRSWVVLDLDGRIALAEAGIASCALKVSQWVQEVNLMQVLFEAHNQSLPLWRQLLNTLRR